MKYTVQQLIGMYRDLATLIPMLSFGSNQDPQDTHEENLEAMRSSLAKYAQAQEEIDTLKNQKKQLEDQAIRKSLRSKVSTFMGQLSAEEKQLFLAKINGDSVA